MIISSIVRIKDVDFNFEPKLIFYKNIICEQFDLQELKKIREDEFVPNIKELSILALENYEKFN